METKICAYLNRFQGTPLISEVFHNYEQELRIRLEQTLGFLSSSVTKVTATTVHSFESACNFLGTVEKDMADLPQFSSPMFQCAERTQLEELFKKLETVGIIKKALTSGLKIIVDAIPPPQEITKQTEANDPNATLIVPAGVFSPTVPMTTFTESIKEDSSTSRSRSMASMKSIAHQVERPTK